MNIETQIKNNKKYFYLKHTINNNSKYKTFRTYLGTSIPKNIEEKKQELYREIFKEVFDKLDLIKNNFQKEWEKLPKEIQKKELEEIAIAFTYNTNAIEGSTITLYETRELLKHNLTPNEKELNDSIESKNHAKVFYDMLLKKEKINKKLLLYWHNELFSQTKSNISGKFREYNVRVGNYYAPEIDEMKKQLKVLFNFSNTTHLHVIEHIARIHYIFEKIHPFGDGNGRIGRLLINYILWHNNYPMIIIENKHKKSYYKALEKDEQGFTNYFIKLYLKVHEKRYLNKK